MKNQLRNILSKWASHFKGTQTQKDFEIQQQQQQDEQEEVWDEKMIDYIELQILIEFTILVPKEKAEEVRQRYSVNEPKWVDVPGLGKYMVIMNPKFEKVMEKLEKIRELKKTPESSYGSFSTYSSLKDEIQNYREEARTENTKAGGLEPSKKANLTQEFKEIKVRMLMIVRIPVSQMGSAKSMKAISNRLLGTIAKQIPEEAYNINIDLRSIEVEGPNYVKTTKQIGALFRSKCLAKGCTNPKVYEWFHPGGRKLNSYCDREDYLAEFSSGKTVRCRSCKSSDHDISDWSFACDQHKDDYRPHK